MRGPLLLGVLVGVASPVLAQSDDFDQGMNTMWEVLWHQSGTPTRLVRWEQEIKVRIYGVNLTQHKQHTLQALQDVAAVAGVKVTDVSGRPDSAQLANVSIEIVPDNMLEDNQPCVTFLNFQTETKIDSAAMQLGIHDDAYLEHWGTTDGERPGSAREVSSAIAAELEERFPEYIAHAFRRP